MQLSKLGRSSTLEEHRAVSFHGRNDTILNVTVLKMRF